jgi:hypothetical protein
VVNLVLVPPCNKGIQVLLVSLVFLLHLEFKGWQDLQCLELLVFVIPSLILSMSSSYTF